MRHADRLRPVLADHARGVAELTSMAQVVLTGSAIPDRALAEAVVRLIAAHLRLLEEHAPDQRGRCPLCRRGRCVVGGMLGQPLPFWPGSYTAPR
jgi:hypothetical protein